MFASSVFHSIRASHPTARGPAHTVGCFLIVKPWGAFAFPKMTLVDDVPTTPSLAAHQNGTAHTRRLPADVTYTPQHV